MTRNYQSSRVARMDRARARQKRRKVMMVVKWAVVGGATLAAFQAASSYAMHMYGPGRVPGAELAILLLPLVWCLGEVVLHDMMQYIKEYMRQITRERVIARRGK